MFKSLFKKKGIRLMELSHWDIYYRISCCGRKKIDINRILRHIQYGKISKDRGRPTELNPLSSEELCYQDLYRYVFVLFYGPHNKTDAVLCPSEFRNGKGRLEAQSHATNTNQTCPAVCFNSIGSYFASMTSTVNKQIMMEWP